MAVSVLLDKKKKKRKRKKWQIENSEKSEISEVWEKLFQVFLFPGFQCCPTQFRKTHRFPLI